MGKYKTGDICPLSGKWLQIETGEILWHEASDVFAPYHKKAGEDFNGAPLYSCSRAHYEMLCEKNCLGCHFFVQNMVTDTIYRSSISLKKIDREKLRKNKKHLDNLNYITENGAIGYSLACHKSCWDQGYSALSSDDIWHQITKNRGNSCFYVEFQEGMLFPAAEELGKREAIQKKDTKTKDISAPKRFKIGLSFPGEQRKFVGQVALHLKEKIGCKHLFYDKYHEPELARVNLDTYLQKLYHDDCELIAVFLCADYSCKEWCGLEWRAIRDLIKKHNEQSIMLLRFDNTEIPGLFSIDGYVEIGERTPYDIANCILQRVQIDVKT